MEPWNFMTFYSEKGRENHPNCYEHTMIFQRGRFKPPTRYVSLQWLLVKVTDPHGFGSNPTFLWVESHHFMKHSSSHHQFWVNSELHMWNLNGSTSLLKNHIFVSEITSFHSKITIVHGYPSFSSWNHHVSCVPSGFFKLNLHFSVGETSVKPAFFAGRPRQVGRELHFETERGGEPRAVINFTNILGGYYSIYVYV